MAETDLFKWRHYESEIILLCVRWYLRYALSYRDLEEMMNGASSHDSAANLKLRCPGSFAPRCCQRRAFQ